MLIVAGGTASTYAGLHFGAAQLSPQTQVVGISVSWPKEKLAEEASRLVASAEVLLDISHKREEFWFETNYIGPGYARLSEGALAAVRFAARQEGVLLDTTYTGKAFAGLIDLVGKGRIRRGSTVVFIHTGGMPELFSKGPQLIDA